MKNATKILHLLGFVMFLGGILGTIVMNIVAGNSADPVLINDQRQFVSAMTLRLTVPGMWITILSGLLMVWLRKYNLFKLRWLTIKAALALVILLNGTFILAPFVSKVTALAAQSAAQGILDANYFTLKASEDMFGAINILFILTPAIVALVKPMEKKTG